MTDHEKEFVDKLLDAGLARYSATEPPAGLERRLLTALKAAPISEESVEELLDGGLARYSNAEPRPGLENRILAGLSRSAGPLPSRWLDWRWAGALATAAAAVVLVIFFFRQPPPPETPPQTASVPAPVSRPPETPAPPVVQPPTAVKGTTRQVPTRVEQAQAELPRLETFPAPAPLSEQERLLLRFMQHAPKEQQVARQLGAGPIEPLQIQPLFLAPLEIQKPTTEN